MSSGRTLSDKLAWDDEQRAIELLDWETKLEDFDRLYAHVVDLLCTRGRWKWSRERLFELLSEEDLRREVRGAAEAFQERFLSLPGYVYLWLKTYRLPELRKLKRERQKRAS